MNGFVGVPHKAILLFVIQKSQGVTEESRGVGRNSRLVAPASGGKRVNTPPSMTKAFAVPALFGKEGMREICCGLFYRFL
jgi:hypothetical protein